MPNTEQLTDSMLRDLQREAEGKDPATFDFATKALRGRADMRQRCADTINHRRARASDRDFVRVVLSDITSSYEGNDPLTASNLAALAEQTTIAWCFARIASPAVTLREAARYVCSYHDMQRSAVSYEGVIEMVTVLAMDRLPPSIQDDARERDERAG